MAASVTQNPAVRSESKSSKKKKAKTEFTEVPAPAAQAAEVTPSVGAAESSNGDAGYESPYIKELYKSIRNVNKKITNASKVDNILAENPGKSLDELVNARKINADQKAQILKKPSLQASLAQLEEQIAQYKKFDQEYKTRSQAEKADFEKSLTERTSRELEHSVTAAKAEAAADALKDQQDSLLLISQFLRLAAVRRGDEEADANLDENKALEGVLAKVYTGDESAVETMIKIIRGSHDTTISVSGENLTTTYADIKTAALAQNPPAASPEGTFDAVDEPTPVQTTEYSVQSDPTTTNVVATELDAPAATPFTNGHDEPGYEAQGIPHGPGVGDGAAKVAAEAHWDNNNDLSTSQEWVEVPRDATETDNGVSAAPAAPSNVQSWADDQPDSPVATTSTQTANSNDGFHEVQRSRGGRDRGDGQFRGRGGRGGDGSYRGRGGFRGDGSGYRGRNRGGPRGGGASRGRRPDES